jgi:hypothetical protein
MKKQWAVNKATEGKVWALPTLVILFRSMLNLSPEACETSLSGRILDVSSKN